MQKTIFLQSYLLRNIVNCSNIIEVCAVILELIEVSLSILICEGYFDWICWLKKPKY